MKKQTMYEILGVSPSATYSEIQAAHQRLSSELELKSSNMDEDIHFKMKIINVAFQTLSAPTSRDAYDAQIAKPIIPNNDISVSSHAIATESSVEAVSLRAEAILLRAEAMSLKADALSLRADAAPVRHKKGLASNTALFFAVMTSPAKKILLVLGIMAAISMVMQVIFLSVGERQSTNAIDGGTGMGAVAAQERLVIEDYYQETGIRAASIAEVERLRTEDRRKAEEQQQKRQEELEKQRIEREYRQFVEESRRQGREVSENLRRAEEQARRDGVEEEMRQREINEEEQRKKENELARIEQEKSQWRAIILDGRQ